MTDLRFDSVRLDVRDMDAAEAFYRDALGFERVFRYDLPDGVIQMMAPGGRPPGVELTMLRDLTPAASPTEHVAFLADDVPSWVERVRRLGYKVEREPFSVEGETMAFVLDPDGHRIELKHYS
ncbi:VOC family protein [Streptomyces sp. MP131-18]|uniref:VOC family protein n=1 Tax=Streptomyces sp. MP131-18 TaxID=1857892 RepID=UPI00097C1F0B|nr:VOC family protein [Streptomyces sp. MP131-18]ONK10482.1 Lactoylglutathione lyase [Streptomyces sp. MP131-18]